MKAAVLGAALAAGGVSAHSATSPRRFRSVHKRLARRDDASSATGQAFWGYQNGVAGNCGQVSQDDDNVAGLSPCQYGDLSAASSLCGKQITVVNQATGASVVANVTDSCTDCECGSLYLSTGAFSAIGSLDEGILDVSWTFVDGTAVPSFGMPATTTKSTATTSSAPAPADDGGASDNNTGSQQMQAQSSSPAPAPAPPADNQQGGNQGATNNAQTSSPAPAPAPASNNGGGVGSASSANGWNLKASHFGGDVRNFWQDDPYGDCQGDCYLLGMDAGISWTSGNTWNLGIQAGNMNGQLRGSNSIRSTEAFNVGTLAIFDFQSLPTGCGHWPSLWMLSQTGQWPAKGEIDIIEYANTYTQNTMSIHTGYNSFCSADGFNGKASLNTGGGAGTDCRASEGGAGATNCAYNSATDNSVGATFNQNGGGVYAIEWSWASGIQMYFWPRGQVPGDVLSGSPNPPSWGQADFGVPSSSCDVGPNNFQDLVFKLTNHLGGTFSSGTWSIGAAGKGAGQCDQITNTDPYSYVTGNDVGISSTYFGLNSVNVWTQ